MHFTGAGKRLCIIQVVISADDGRKVDNKAQVLCGCVQYPLL